jgi:hypothetical protein
MYTDSSSGVAPHNKSKTSDPMPSRFPFHVSRRSKFQIAAWLVGLACFGALIAMFLPDRAPRESQNSAPAEPQSVLGARSTTPQRTGAAKASATSGQRSALLEHTFPKPTLGTSQMVSRLVNLETTDGVMTEEQVAGWKERMKQLVQQGADAVPAIREFLAGSSDIDFGRGGKQALGYDSARMAMFDALAQIGGPLATAAMSEVLQTTADPREIGLLAQNLEKADPGAHQQEAMEAARQTLAMAAAGNLKGKDVAPLFEIFREYGGPGAVAELERNATLWNFYSMMALAQLPEGAGVPSLIQFAASSQGTSSSSRTAALEMLAQTAAQSPEARAALVDQARQNQLSAFSWATLVNILAGDEMVFQNTSFGNGLSAVNPSDLRMAQVALGHQCYFMAPLGAQTQEQIDRQNKLIDDLLAVTTDRAGVDALQKAKTLLAKRLPQVASAEGKGPGAQ